MLSQAQRDDAKEWFVSKMVALYKTPFHLKDEALMKTALAEYVDALGGYGPVVLDDAWHSIRQSHKGTWPDLSECLKACREAQRLANAIVDTAPKSNPYEVTYERPDPVMSQQQQEQLQRDLRQLEADKRAGSRLAPSLIRLGKRIQARHNAAVEKDRTI